MASFKDETNSLDVYSWFFFVCGGIAASVIIGAIGLVMFTDPNHGNPYIIYPISTLITTALMGNMGESSISAKEMFWGWVFLTFGLAALGLFGVEFINIIKLFIS